MQAYPRIYGTEIKKVALVKMGALGDLVWTVPLVQTLLQHYSQLNITWIVSHELAPILRGVQMHCPRLQLHQAKRPKGIRDYWDLRKSLANQHFELLISAQTGLRYNLISPLVKAKIRLGLPPSVSRDGHFFFQTDWVDAPKGRHEMDKILAFLKPFRIPIPQEISWRWGEQFELTREFDFILQEKSSEFRGWVGINPGASHPYRRWSSANWAEIIFLLNSAGMGVVLTGSRSERGPGEEIVEGRKKFGGAREILVNLIGRTPLQQLIPLFSRLTCFVAPDTGPLHLAHSLGIPCVGLYAVLPSALTGPYGGAKNCVDVYSQVAEKIFNIPPGLNYRGNRLNHPSAMGLITVNMVWSKLQSIIGEKKNGGPKGIRTPD